ncbi:bacterial extracellular solute-binding s, 5 Middle family protein [Mycobacterium xenopi 4042]|uniref:Bacterial extracellular solute-binding s, 5 Middle family protein n=1 Tax=Mycobacterium xenopi 4042 TaxID=1299334 RepID=X8AM13_MYCXE|nr:bacterial extracellular solute-binding s, 5 Middle family protein [Mycobacterium xenopi 4042]
MPSHVIGDELGVDVTTALQTNNMPVVDRIAQVWNTTWDLKPGVDLKHFPSSGPYKIEKLLDGGAVVLVANDRWWGTKPVTKRITVWPQEADIQDRVNNKSVDVVDVAAGSSGSLITPDDYQRTDSASAGIEQLIFAPVGRCRRPGPPRARAVHAARSHRPRRRRADRQHAAARRRRRRPRPGRERHPAAASFTRSDPAAARSELGGAPLSVRIGYRAPNARLAAIVGAIAKACGPAGVAVSDATSPSAGPRRSKPARSTPCWPAPEAPPAADRPGRRRWTPTPCTAATATTSPVTATVKSTASSAPRRFPPTR